LEKLYIKDWSGGTKRELGLGNFCSREKERKGEDFEKFKIVRI